MIGNQKININDKNKEKSTRCSWWWTTRKKKEHTAQQKEGNQETKLREDINSEREEQSVKPQQRDHSKSSMYSWKCRYQDIVCTLVCFFLKDLF